MQRDHDLGNAIFSTVSGLLFSVAAGSLANLIGIELPLVVRIVGVCLLGFAAFVGFIATRPEIDLKAALTIVIGDLAWVVGTVPLVMTDLLSTHGIIAAIAIADIVLLFAGLQYYGVRRVRGAESIFSAAAA